MPLGETDPVRITLQTASLGITGEEAAEIFRAHFVEPEYADNANLVLIATPFHTEQDFLRVEQAIQALPNRTPLKLNAVLPSLPNSVMSVRQAVFSAWGRNQFGRQHWQNCCNYCLSVPSGCARCYAGRNDYRRNCDVFKEL